MRNTAAILLGGILLFNWIGYRFLNNFMQDKANHLLVAQLDRQQYDESQLVSLKVPVTLLSYYNNSMAFQRVDGQIEVNGITYQYVKSRIYNDSLELLCIPNAAVMKLRLSGLDYFKLVNGIERGQQGQHPAQPVVTKDGITDPYTISDAFTLRDRCYTVVKRWYTYDLFLPSTFLYTDERPPDLLA